MTEPVFTSEEYMRASRIGPLRRQPGPIVLVDYDAAWPALFEREAERVRAVLGDRVLRIEHAGSTSVPGLCAKPIVDIVLVVADAADEPAYVPRLEAAGYVLRIREPDWFEHRLFKGPDTNVNLHVLPRGREERSRARHPPSRRLDPPEDLPPAVSALGRVRFRSACSRGCTRRRRPR